MWIRVLLLLAVCVGSIWGQTDADEAYYQQREAGSPGIEQFTGGAHGFALTILVVAAVVVIVWLVLEHHRHHL